MLPAGRTLPFILRTSHSSSARTQQNTGSTINNRLSLLLLAPPPYPWNPSSGQTLPALHSSTLCLMLASSFSVNPPNTSMDVIVLDSSWWRACMARPSRWRTKGALCVYLRSQTLLYLVSLVLNLFPLNSCGSVGPSAS